MKLLFDQNISFRVVKGLASLYPRAKQVRELGLENATDRKIWDYAKENGYTLVTFDADFYDFVTLYGHPPKVIWLRQGNTSSKDIIKLFDLHFDSINSFITDNKYNDIACLEID